MSKKQQDPAVIAAARLIEDSIVRLEETTTALQSLQLNSQKNLERSAKLLDDVATADEQLGLRLRGFVEALNDIRGRQEQAAQKVQAVGLQIAERSKVYASLLEEYRDIGEGAAHLNLLMQSIAADRPKGEEGKAKLDQLEKGMEDASEKAHVLARRARDVDFGDMSRQAESLKQQLHAAALKLKPLKNKLTE